ncbi:MAG: hypothetical protein IJR49_00375, partial [Treponema sp.]|nr:hypothetical protein [Treponema sp.]
KYDKKLADITRSHSIDIQLFRKDKEFSHNYSIVNSSNIQAFTHIAFTSSQGITFECTQNSIMRLLLNLSFSVKLTF